MLLHMLCPCLGLDAQQENTIMGNSSSIYLDEALAPFEDVIGNHRGDLLLVQ